VRTNSQLQSAARALADQLDMRMKDLEAQSQRRVAAEQASLQAETERLKQVCVVAVTRCYAAAVCACCALVHCFSFC
jgi:hypothetical protein